MNDVKLGIHAAGHARAAGDKILAGGISGNTNGHALADTPIFPDVLVFHVGFEAAVDLFGDLAQGEFAESDEVAAAEEIFEGAFDFFGAVDVAALHAVVEGFGSEVDHDGFRGCQGNPVGDRFADGDSGDGADDGRDAFDVLNVERGDDVDFRGEKILNIFVALAMLAAGNIGVGQFIDEDDLRLARKNGIHIHFFEDGSLVLHFSARNGFHLGRQLFDAFAAVGFDDANDHVFAAAAA